MRQLMTKLSIAFAIGLAGLMVLNGCKKEEGNAAATGTEENGKVVLASFNDVCPVSGDPVDPEIETVEFQGKTIGFCCTNCLEKWKNEMTDEERQSMLDELMKKAGEAMDDAEDKMKEGMEKLPGGGGG